MGEADVLGHVDLTNIHDRSCEYWSGRVPEYSDLHEREMDSERGGAFMALVKGLPYIHSGAKVLDLGCGSGFVTIALAAAHCVVTSIDFSCEMLEQARANVARRNLSAVDFRQMDVHNLDFADDTFDVVMTRNVTWILEDVARVYAEAMRVLKPGGTFVNFDVDYGRATLERIQAGIAPRHPTQTAEQLRIRDSITVELPISRAERPLWDIKTLWDLGASGVSCRRSLNRLLLGVMPEGTDPCAVKAEPGTQGDLFVIEAVK